jgi:hypothetical protein
MKLHRSHAVKVLEWCKRHYGRSNYNGGYPTISYTKPDYMLEDLAGYYCEQENHIYINCCLCCTLDELVETVIHEYTHYKQNMYHYQIVARYVKRQDNPFEHEADKIAKRDRQKCIEEMHRMHSIFND